MILAAVRPSVAQSTDFANWPARSSPTEIGKRLAEHFVVAPHQDPRRIIYPEVCTWYGALTFAQLSGDKDLSARLIKRFDPLMTPAESGLIVNERHVDYSVFGAVPLEIYIETKEQKYLDMGKAIADRQWMEPTPEGLTSETRFWIDDAYMITILQLQAYRATGDKVYLDRAALEMAAYLDKLQKPNGLFYHGPDFPFYWGRGNGWVAGGMAELLGDLPENHPKRARILQGYRTMMASLLKYQDADGIWHQLIDHPESYQESSCTAMFAYAMITGVKKGWLKDKAYSQAARKGWLGVNKFIGQDGNVDKVCVGTGQTNDVKFYLNRPTEKGNPHGQAPALWCVNALLRK